MEASNVKAMRDALLIAKKAICHHARANHTCDSLAWENDTANANCGDILCAHRDLCEAKTAIQKALSEPARNCDVYNTKDAAMKACHYDRCFCKSPIDERESVISFMLSECGPEAKSGEKPDRDTAEEGGAA